MSSVENEKKKGMMAINLRSVVAVTSLGGGITSLRNLCMHLDFPRPLAEHSYESYLKYLEEKLIFNSERCMLNAASEILLYKSCWRAILPDAL